MKVLSRKIILDLLKSGCTLNYDQISVRVYIEDADLNERGSVRFDTYLKLIGEGAIIKTKQRYLTEIYALA